MDIIPPTPQQPSTTPPAPAPAAPQPIKVAVNMGDDSAQPAPQDNFAASPSTPSTPSTPPEPITPPTTLAPDEMSQPAVPADSTPAPAPEPVQVSTPSVSAAQPMMSQSPQPAMNQQSGMGPRMDVQAPSNAAQQQGQMPQASPSNPNQMQSPSVFDTNQYHLPIEKGKKHNAGLQMLIFVVVFLAVVVIGGMIAIDADLIQVGFKLPFDLIK